MRVLLIGKFRWDGQRGLPFAGVGRQLYGRGGRFWDGRDLFLTSSRINVRTCLVACRPSGPRYDVHGVFSIVALTGEWGTHLALGVDALGASFLHLTFCAGCALMIDHEFMVNPVGRKVSCSGLNPQLWAHRFHRARTT